MKKVLLFLAFIGSCFSLSAQYCITAPSLASGACGGTAMRFQAFNLTGASGAISDVMPCNSTGYMDRTVLTTTLYKGGTYSCSVTSGPSNQVYSQVWVDFNNDFVFSAGETIGGTGTGFTNTSTFALNIPLGAPSGTFRMRAMVSWTGNGGVYPTLNPCMTGYSYGEARDYSVTITPPPPSVATSVSSVSFGNVAVSATSAAQVFSMTGTFMTSTPVTVATSSSNFEFSFNNTTWFSTPQTYAYTLPGFTSIPLYVRFTPTAATSYLEYINISGGGLATTKSVAVLGTGAIPCSGTPTEGTAAILPMAGSITTPFTLSTTGYSATSGITFQWQSSPTGTGSWTDISGATNATHSFTGISSATFYRCNVTCSISTTTVATNVVSATLFPASTCTPAFSTNSCPVNAMNASIASLVGVGSTITDPSTGCSGASHYFDNSGTMSCTLLKGSTYNPTLNLSNAGSNYGTNMSVQIWIDFNGDGAFSHAEAVGGTGLASGTVAGVTSLPITIPSGAPTGTFRMRIEGNYQSSAFTTYPTMNPCPTTSTTYGQVRDYRVNIIAPPPCATPLTQAMAPFTFSSSLFNINGSFAAAPTSTENYLVVATTSSVAPTAPTDGVTYSPGATALGGKIVSTGSSTSFSATGLSDNTPYWFWVYSFNSGCTGGPKYLPTSPLSGTFSTTACALSGVKTVGPTGDYTNLATAIANINSLGVATGGLALELQPAYTGETFPITITTLTCASADRRVTIRPQSTAVTVTANTSGQMISLSGTRYLTIDGRVGSTGSTSLLTFINNYTSSSSNSCAIQFINDASNNEVKYTSLRGGSTSTIGGVVLFGTTTGTTGCDSNVIDNCEIRESAGLPINCIYSSGTTGKENSGNTISNCNISNFYNSSSSSNGIFLSSGNTDWTITANRLFQSAARTYTSGVTNRGILISNSSTGNNFSITNNIIGYSNSTSTGNYTINSTAGMSFYGISFSGASTTPSSIQGNIITNIVFTTSFGMLRGIDVTSGSVNIGTTSANIIGAATGTGAISATSSSSTVIFGGIYSTAASPSVLNIQNNTIGSVALNGTSTTIGAGFYGIFASGTASTSITDNIVGSTTTANSIHSATSTTSTGTQTFYCIYASVSSSTPVNLVISGNTIANITGNSTGTGSQMYGMYLPNSASSTISGNNIYNLSTRSRYTTLSTAAGLVGILYTGSSATATITGNDIHTLENLDNNTFQSNVVGILYTGAVNGTIAGNKIYDLRNASTNSSTTSPPTAIGLFSYSPGTSVSITNNMISLGNAQTTNTSFVGIAQGVSTSALHKIYFNTVLIEGTAGTSSIHTAALHRGNFSGTSYTTPLDIDNNILMNSRSGGGTGKHFAIANNINGSATTSGWASNASNYNILNAANAATVGYWNGDRTFATWQSASACDNNSYTASAVTFTNSAIGDLHINMGTTANNMESHGLVISGFNTDYDNHTRPGPTGSVNGGGFGVDIGADEFDGVPLDNIPPVINYTNGTCGTAGNYTFTATVADPAGVPTTGVLVPRVYYRKGAGTWFSSAGTLTSGSGTNGVWTFTITATDMGGLVAGNVVSYYVIAQDNSSFVGSNPSPGLVATDVNTVTTPPTSPSTFTVGLSGSYTVGSGGDFNTITLAATAYNNYCLTGPVTYNLITSTYPSETFPITFNGIATANATNTLTIKPAASTAVTINGATTNGAIFKLLNAKHITIDGVNAGGSSLTLNSTFTSTYANIWLASTSSTGPGCSNITLKNMTITGGSNATSGSYGILGGLDNGTFPTTSGGFNNDTITIQNNTITKCYYGIYASGTSSASNGGGDDWVITGNTFGPASSSSTDNIGMRGVHFANMINPAIVNNTFRNIGTSSITSQAVGIYLSSSVNGGSYSQNTITDISNVNTGSSTSSNAGIYVGTTCINLTIAKNIIRDIATTSTSGGARGITINPSNTTANILIANNMISDIECFGTTSISQCPVGIGVDNTAGLVKVYYNTVHLNSSYAGNTTATGSACYFQSSSSAGTDLRNNNFVNTYNNTNSGTDKGWAFYTTVSSTAFAEINNNNYFASSPNIVGYTSGDRTTLTDLQSVYGRNANSISISPTFVSATDLRLQTISGNTPLVAATPVSVAEDIDGNSRSITTPVIGVHEVAFCSSITAGTVSAAASTLCGSGTTTVTATGATTGESMQWRSSTDGSTWTTIAGATNASYVISPDITTTTQYRFVNKCAISALADSATTTVTVNPLPDPISLSSGSTTTTYTYTGASQTFTVPSGVTSITINAYGAAGGNAADRLTTNATGGSGSLASGTLAVTPGQVLQINVGGAGATTGAGGFNGGGNGGTAAAGTSCSGGGAGGGGGASDVRTGAFSLTDRLIVGAGGGGSGRDYCNGTCQPCGCGGSGGAGDFNGVPAGNCGFSFGGTGVNFGAKGLVGSAGAGGPGDGTGISGAAGAFGSGGNGAAGSRDISGGGGGGGYYGGGGGGGATNGSGVAGGGGGGGSSYTGGVTSGSTTTNSNTGNGFVIISYSGASGSMAVCVGNATTLTNATAGGTWSSSNSNVSIGGTSGVATGVTAGTATVSYIVTATGCYSTAVVTVNALPTVSAGSDVGICNGGNTVLSATGAATYQWAPAASLSASTGTSVTASPTTTTTYTLTGTAANTCVNTASVTVSINPTPAAVTVSGAGAYCNNTTITASGGTGGTIYFQGTTSGGTSTAIPGTSEVITASGTYYFRSRSSLGCWGPEGSASVTINPNAGAVTASGAGTYCNSATITASGGSGGTIYFQGTTSGGTSTAIASSSEVVTSSGTYYFRARTAAGCWGAEGSVAVTINSLPTVSSISATPSTLCEGEVLTLTGTGAAGTGSLISYNWTGPNGYSTTTSGSVQTYTVPSTAASGIYSVSVTYTGTGCTSSIVSSSSVTVAPLPNVYNVTGGGVVCSGESVHIGLDWSIVGINYQLYNGSTAVGSPVTGATSALDFGLIGVAGTYTVRATNTTSGCVNHMSGSATVSVNPLPTAYSVTGGGTTCENSGAVSVGLSSSATGFSYQLYNGAATVGTPLSGTGAALSFGPQNTSGTYTVLATNNTTLCTNAMTGSAVVVINPAPTAYTVTGGGNYCSGGSGVSVGLSGSNTGIHYQLYNGGATVGSPVPGTGSAISFGNQTAAATFTVVATNTVTACPNNMTGSATVVINALPTVHTVTGGGNYCAGGSGVAVGLSSSNTGINYQLYNGSSTTGSPVAGTGAAISYGNQTAAGTYTVRATNTTTSCVSNMTGSAVVVINPLPTAQTVTGGGSYCTGGTGVSVGLNGSATGINYQLYNGASPTGSAVAGTGSAISFGLQTAAGTYTVRATNSTTGCVNDMTASATVVINPLPTVFVITGGGNYCAGGTGVAVGLNGSESGGISYQLYNGAAASGSPVIGTGSAISFGLRTTAGAYSVVATNTVTACTSNMFGSTPIVIDPLPTPQNITGGGSYCAGGSGLPIGLDFSNTGINYQLYNGASLVGSPVAGTGVAISFGSQTASGTYSVLATNSITTCTNAMTGTATIIINPLPTVQTVTGGGTYCENFGGVAVGLSGSQTGIAYQLYNGASTMGSPVAGTGSAVSFGAQTLAGTYTVVATNTVTACANDMTGNAIVIMNPAPPAYTLIGGGSYCAGSTGRTIGLESSDAGITYQLYNGASAAGSAVAGTGDTISFGTFTASGTYTVLATNDITACTNPMTGNAVIIINPIPELYSVTGGGSYCNGGTGVNVGLSNSDTGIIYQLYRGGAAVGSPVTGTGHAFSFGLQTIAGTYSILATHIANSCTRAMTGIATVSINPLPVVYNVTGGGNACLGGIGVNVGVDMSQSGVNYNLKLGTIVMGTLGGTASGLNFGMMYASGTYSVLATNATTGCSSAMSGSASVVLHNPPVAYTMTGGGSYCAGSGGVAIGLSNSATGVNYRLYAGSTAMGSGPTAGTGAAISFGSQTVAGTYTVLATSTTSGCTNTMTGSTTISINSLPGIHTVSGGGNYCPGAGGANISLSGSNTGITYQLYVGSTPIGTPVTGSGATLYMGTHTTVGTYSAVATNVTTGCTSDMAGSATIAAYSLPNIYVVTGGGNYCSGGAGVAVGLSGSETGVSYQLYNGSSIVGTYTGTGAALSFGILGAAGIYSVRATNTSTSCVNNMTGTATIIINDLPNTYLVTGGGNYCAGGSGYSVILNGSNTGINYQLFNGTAAMGASVAGTGSAINFGLQTVAGLYTVRATNATTGCTRIMAGSPTIIVHPLPTVFNVSGGGSYCIGSLGVEITLDGSNAGIGYQLLSGSTTVGSMMSGSGGAVSFGLHTIPGTYTIMATNTGTGCTSNMAGSAFVVANPVPAIQTVTGGGGYCSGSAGSPVGINASATGTNYQLYRGTATVGSPLSGVGGALEFGLMTTPGVYTVRAVISATGCTSNMTGTAVVSINPLPNEYSVSGGGVYCSGGVGANITLGGSDAGVTYRLYNGSLITATLSGTGSTLDFGPQTSGVYTVLATNTTTSCQNTMTGSASVIANPIPVPFVVTGGGIHCTGSAGVAIGLAGSQTGVNYSLYNAGTATGSVVSGTGSAVSFGLQAATGNYTVLATNATTACTNAMTGSVTVSVNPLPAVQAVTGGGSYCAGGAGVTVGLASSETGMLYQLYKNGTALSSYIGGTGGAISFGAQYDNGEYTVMAINIATTCTRQMAGSATINTNPLPVAYAVSGGGAYCAGGTGVTINLSGSTSGVSYQLYNGTVPTGSPLTASGSALSYFGVTAAGTYTILATNTATSCSRVMTGTANVTINPVPVVENVTGGGAYCAGSAGVSIGLSSSTTGVAYTLYNGTTATGSAIAGTGSALNFGVISGAGTYTVSAVNSSTACAAAMAGSATVSVNTVPAAFEVIGGGGYCAGGAGVSIALSGSQTGINYLLYNNATGTTTTFAGTGDLIEFGMQTVAGTYTVSAVNTTTSCTSNMTGEAAVVISPMPVAFSITGGGNYCEGTAGVAVGLNGSEFGVNYRLYKDGIATGTTVAGTGAAISFGTHAATGTYTAIGDHTASTCSIAMTGSATIGVHPTPAVYTISAGGSYCTGTAGLMVSLNNSENGVNYRLYNGATLVGSFVAGTGSAISFGMQPAGLYAIMATNTSTSCTAAMSGIAAISVNALPVIYNVTGSGGYCSDAAGVAVGLSGSQNNVNYQLYNGATAVGSSVAGNGGAISFGNYPAGIYSVVGTSVITTCTSNMTGNANIFINAQPNTYNVSGGGDICTGASGVTISLDGSQTGVNYRLYNGTTAIGSIVAGTGTSLNFGMITVGGNYTIRAQNTGNTCTRTMTGSASVAVNPLPVVYNVTGGGSFCPGGTGVSIGLSGSEAGVDYQLYSGSSMAGASVAGTGSAIDFGMYTAEGSYMVVATNTTTSCGANMSGSANVALNSQPAVYTLASSASGYCEGGAGVLFNLSGSQSGVTYRLYNGTTPVSGVTTGTGSSINFGLKTLAGSYSVLATDVLNGCTTVMTGSPSITVNPLPGVFTVSGGGAYCAGGSGAPITIIGSQTGINYQLYNGTTPIGSAIAGTGAGLTFGTTLPAGMYTVKATNPVSSCTSNMMGTASVIVNALPSAYNVTGGGQYCTGGSGLPIGLAGSSTGITYRLYNAAGIVGSPVTGTGAALSFGIHTAAGSYSITATNPVTACIVNMTGTAVINASATLAVHTVTGGGAICSGATGVSVGLSGSANGVNYRLYNGTTPVGLAMAGTGSAISFGTHATAGTYTIQATDAATSCTKAMSGNAVISINALPAVHTVTGGGNYCTGGSGVSIGLDGSATGVSYRLYHGTTPMGTIAGGGSPLDFGMQTSTGAYTIKATNTTTGCTSTMAGTAVIGITPSVVSSVSLTATTGDTVCAGTTAMFTTAATNAGTTPSYAWYVNGIEAAGTAASFSYTPAHGDVVRVAMSSSAACALPATTTDERTLTVRANQMPAVTAVVEGGDTICDGNPVIITATPLFGGDSPSFTWIKNGITSAVGNVFTYTPAHGDVVSVRMTSNYSCRLATLVNGENDTLNIAVPYEPVVSIVANPGTTIAEGQILTLTAAATLTYMPTYQWHLNGNPIHGATSSSFTYNNYEDKDTVTVSVTNNTPCGALTVFNTVLINVNTVGVATVDQNTVDVRLMPNPANGTFTIKGTISSKGNDAIEIEISDMLGQIVYRGNTTLQNSALNKSIELSSSLANGMYLVNLRTPVANKVLHLILQR